MKQFTVAYTIVMDLSVDAPNQEKAIAKAQAMMEGVNGLDRIPADKLDAIRRARIATRYHAEAEVA